MRDQCFMPDLNQNLEKERLLLWIIPIEYSIFLPIYLLSCLCQYFPSCCLALHDASCLAFLFVTPYLCVWCFALLGYLPIILAYKLLDKLALWLPCPALPITCLHICTCLALPYTYARCLTYLFVTPHATSSSACCSNGRICHRGRPPHLLWILFLSIFLHICSYIFCCVLFSIVCVTQNFLIIFFYFDVYNLNFISIFHKGVDKHLYMSPNKGEVPNW